METQPVPPQHSPVGPNPKTSGLAIGGLVVSSLALAGTTVAILFFVMLDNSLSGAEMKANREKCKNNLNTIQQAMNARSGDIEGCTPHLWGASPGMTAMRAHVL